MKLLDFGIAKLLSEESETAPAGALTQLDGRPFTPEYAAPEQVQGGEATIRTDVYALGVLLYMLLTGSHPTSRAEAPAHERLRAILEQDPVPLAQAVRNITSGTAAARASTAPRLARQLRGDLQRIVAKALHKDPARRYATVAEFADDVNRHLRHEPVRARGDAFFYRAGRFLRRHRFAVGAAAAVAIALIAGAAATLWQAVEARRERDEALFQAQMANARADIVNMIQGAVGESGRPLTQREILDRSVDVVARRFGDRPRVAVGLLLPIAGQFFTLGDSEKDFAIMRRAAGIAAASGDSQLVADVACNTVATELRRGHPDEAASQLRRGLDAQARVARPKFSTVIECLRAEADLAQERGDFDLARVKLETAVARLETDRDLGGNLFPSVVSDLASVDTMRDDLPGALAAIKKEQHSHERFGLTDSAEYLGSLRQEAAILAGWGEYRQARAILLAVDARWRGSTAGSATPAWLDQSVGVALLRFGDAAAAAERLHIASEKSRQLGDTARAAATSLSRAQALIALGRLDEAETALRAAQQGNVPNDAFRLLGPATVQAALEAARGKTRDAAAGIDAELARLRAAPRSSRALLAALKVAASVYLEADVARARQYARDAVALAERIARTPGQSADVGEALLLLARAEQRANERDRARQTAQRAAECLANGYAADHPLARAARALAAG